ncbi:ATP-binding cassette sub-family G member 1-like [Oppia nitens]|uniref:ATP-binding cassette sub-family G member 1-like n=1 Tax=Oppia nitens TaxID=1686743 RepID=UPI0023D9C004|nr:ATP-binding cassette sub-family G member 1-like [Oppia nitens]
MAVALFLIVFLLGGLAVRLATLDMVFRSISNLSFIRFAFESTMIIIYGMDRCDVNFEGKILILDQFEINDNKIWTNMYWLIAIAWIDLSYGKKDWFSKHSKVILNSLNGRINYHTLTALMGPSGAGKSTLLKCINMRQTSGITCDSKIYVNQCTDFKTCFIMQSSDEHLWLGLTVRESLLFASKIKNYKIKYWEESYNMSTDFICDSSEYQSSKFRDIECQTDDYWDRDKHIDHNLNVNKIIGELLLEDCADTLVLSCSGGEQKRLTIGLELVQQSKPNLMCIDEPTTGLDSNTSEMIIQCLKQLSVRHRMAIVTSIHQPNSIILSMFDQLYVLAKGGYCVYMGQPSHLRSHLSLCNIKCTDDVLPIELLLKIAALNGNDTKRSAVKNGNTSGGRRISRIDQLATIADKQRVDILNECIEKCQIVTNTGIGLRKQYFNLRHFYYLTLRTLHCFYHHDWLISLLMFVFLIFISLFMVYLFGRVGADDGCLDVSQQIDTLLAINISVIPLKEAKRFMTDHSMIMQNVKLLYFILICMAFISISCSVLYFPRDVRVFINEHRNRWYSAGVYYWSRLVIDTPILIAMAVAYSTVIFYTTGQLYEWYRYEYFTITLVACMIITHNCGMFIGTVFSHNFQLASTAAITLLIMCFLLGGFPVKLSTLDVVMKWLSHLSFIRHTFECLLLTTYGFNRCHDSQLSVILNEFNLNDDIKISTKLANIMTVAESLGGVGCGIGIGQWVRSF